MSHIFRWIIQLFSLYLGTSYKKVSRTHITPPIVGCLNVGTFDGAAQNGLCGGGGTLSLTGGRILLYKVGLGLWTNSRA